MVATIRRVDRDRLHDAFMELRTLGYFARVNHPNGWKAVPETVHVSGGKVCFWHANEDSVAFDSLGYLRAPLHLHHRSADAPEIIRVLGQHGVRGEVAIDDYSGLPMVKALPRESTSAPVIPEWRAAACLGNRYTCYITNRVSSGPGTVHQHVVFKVDAVDGDDGTSVRLGLETSPPGYLVLPASTFEAWVDAGVLTERV